MVALTIGMATYNDFDGVYFTLQALRLYHDLQDTELLVVDNFGCEHTKQFVEAWVQGRYIRATEAVGTSAPRDLVFQEASGEAVLCCDSHVLFAHGAIGRLKQYYREHPDCIDLLQGPLLYDDLRNLSTHFEPQWRDRMWGTWATDPAGIDPEGQPFEIPMQGLGAFSCRKSAWLGFNPQFRGFGGEEGYIHEKFRQAGARCLCLPWFRWGHRFGRPAGVPYPVTIEDRLHNYVVGHAELGLDLAPVLEHFAEHLQKDRIDAVVDEALQGGISGSPRQVHANIIGGSNSSSTPFPATGYDTGLPLVSCICATYNRAPSHQHLVEEVIESFLRQSYPNKELIVLNDCPGQELVCDAPGVRVVNVPERFPTLGEKHNAAIALARGELIAMWDDDDISLPWRLTFSVERLGGNAYFNPQRHWFMDRDDLRPDQRSGVGHNLSLFTRAAFDAVGGYPPIGSGVDLAFDRALRAQVTCVGSGIPGQEELSRSEVYYIYRWGVSPAHLSAVASEQDRPASYSRIGTRPVQQGQFVLRPHWLKDYVSETRRLVETTGLISSVSPAAHRSTSADSTLVPVDTGSISASTDHAMAGRRAIVCFVEDKPHLIQQVLALRLSWLYAQSPDTDLVVMGPEDVLARLPDDLVKIAQQPAADDPVWRGHRYINALACLNDVGAEQLDRYSHLLRTDVDTFITPAWNQFYPTAFTFGSSTYANDDVPRRIQAIAADYGLVHRGMTNIHTTWYGPTAVVRRAAAFAEMLTKHILTRHFASDEGKWPGWYRGVAIRYAGEIAVNHCAPDAQRSELLDASSTSQEPVARYPHIHCWHTDQPFSKHAFMNGTYTPENAHDLDLNIIRDYCLALSLRSVEALALVP